jgi:large subunit ribosomal protein L30
MSKMKKYRIKQVTSKIGRSKRQKATLEALGLTKMQQVREVEGTPQVMGMISKVNHLITVEEI